MPYHLNLAGFRDSILFRFHVDIFLTAIVLDAILDGGLHIWEDVVHVEVLVGILVYLVG